MIDDLISEFSPETFSEWCREKFDRFTADPHDVPNDEGFPQARVVGYVNVLSDGEVNRPLLVMSVYVGQQINERSSRRRQFDFARKQLQTALNAPPAKVKGLFTQGLFAFHDSKGNFRLSLVSGRADGKRLVYGDFKRQSFFVHPDRKNKTFHVRMEPAFGSYGDLSKAFSVEALTKEFYSSLFAWYERAMAPESNVTFPNDIKRNDDDRMQLADHLIRLITRLMFIWFIRQKGLIPDKIFDPDELKKILKSFDPVSPKQDNYYRAILQNLFFATLNCEIKDREFANEGDDEEERKEHYGIKLLYRYHEEFACTKEEVKDLFRRIPFLNGGLFECLDRKKGSHARSPVIYHDGFSRNPDRRAHIPNNLFFDDHGLLTLFSRYDFTVDENDPNDSDVALDPELLGKVFENLLGAYNPETKETARKQSGSFYTPREIVNYMVDESLKAHLLTQCGAGIPACQGYADKNVCATLHQGGAGIPACRRCTDTNVCATDSQISISRRRLPHWHMDGAIYWVCFRLADSIPLDKLRAWQAERTLWCQANAEPWTEQQWQEYNRLFGDRYEAWLDAGMGSRALAREDVRQTVVDCLTRFHGDRLLIHAAVIMPTHIHALIEPLPVKKECTGTPAGKNACHTLPYHKLSDLLHGIKGASARAANKILGTTGTAFWMDESYDHIVRNEKQYRHFRRYIQENPVKVGLKDDEYWLIDNVATQEGEAGISACQDAQTGMSAPLSTNVGQAFLPAGDAQTGMSAPLPLSQRIEALFAPDGQDVPFTDAERRDLVNALYHCRILDPACGSGAFPMGLLLKMVNLLQRLDPKNTLWHEVVMAEAEKALAAAESLGKEEKEQHRRRITESFDQSINHPDYARKLYLIENCIFGVDIQPIAVQIAKLRAFITLVCDQTPDLEDEERNYRMLPLPNLETKFVAANTLIGLASDFAEGLKTAGGASLMNDPELHRLRTELAEVRHRHFRARSASEKNACRKRDGELRKQIKARLVAIACKPDAEKIALWQAEIEKLRLQRHAVEKEDWQEVVGTVPTQIDMFATSPKPEQTMLRVDMNKEQRDRLDDDIRRITRSIETEQNRSKNKSAFQHEAERLADWDPYNQNASSSFFDPEWMFGFKGGFDIVIGNPPYVQIQKLPEKDKAAYANEKYKTFSKSSDLFCLFYERGGTLLNDSGSLCYITSNKFFRSGYGKPLRQLLQEKYVLQRLIDFGELPVFEAGTDPVITQFGKEARADFIAAIIKNADDIQNIPRAVALLGRTMTHEELSLDGWSLSGREAAGILEKMRRNSTPLGEYVNGEIYRGILTGFNDAFIIDNATREALIAADPKSSEIIVPLAKGDDVRKWHIRDKGRWLILTKTGVPIKRYPAIFAHLKKWEKELKARKDQGNQWWELRTCSYYDVFSNPKIVYPEIARESRFALDSGSIYPLKTVFSMPSSDRFLLGVLNSKATWHYLKNTCSSLGDPEKGGRLLMQAIYLETLPIPSATPEQQTTLANLVERILAATKVGQAFLPARDAQTGMSAPPSSCDTSSTKVGQAFLPAGDAQTGMSAPPSSCDISSLEAKIDRLVYELYGLTDDEIAIVEGREKVGQAFLPAKNAQTRMSAPPSNAPPKKKPRKSVMTEDPDLS